MTWHDLEVVLDSAGSYYSNPGYYYNKVIGNILAKISYDNEIKNCLDFLLIVPNDNNSVNNMRFELMLYIGR